jgi:hypothetical protein
LSCVCEGIRVCVDDLAFDLVGPATIVSPAASDGSNVTLSHWNSFSVIKRLNGSQKINVLLNQIGKLDQQLATVLWCSLPPWAFKGLTSSSYRNIDILLGGLMDGADDFLSGRIDRLEGLAIDTLNPLVVDEPARPNVSLGGISERCGVVDGGETYKPVGWVYLPVDGVESSIEVIVVNWSYVYVYELYVRFEIWDWRLAVCRLQRVDIERRTKEGEAKGWGVKVYLLGRHYLPQPSFLR